MILYRPVDGDVRTTPIKLRVKTCFLMTQIGGDIPPIIKEIKMKLIEIFEGKGFKAVDADSFITGNDFMLKIWQIAISVPIGVAIIHEKMSPQTMANIFCELGWMQALGKEIIVIKSSGIKIPSDFVRTEYISYDEDFEQRICTYIDSLYENIDYYITVAHQLERNPLLAIDYLRRAYLLTGDKGIQLKASKILSEAGLKERDGNSVEMLLANFINDDYE